MWVKPLQNIVIFKIIKVHILKRHPDDAADVVNGFACYGGLKKYFKNTFLRESYKCNQCNIAIC
jgi:hypothetical protein